MAEISVVIPCYNVEAYIDECIESLVNQTFGIERMELIFVNDASTDETLEKLVVWEQMYPDSITVVQLQENSKQGTARNIGIQYATGRYLGFVDADDYVEITMFQKMYEFHQREDVEFVTCSRWDEYPNGAKTRLGPKADGILDLTESDIPGFLISHQSPGGIVQRLYKREWIMELDIWFPEKLAYEDNFWAAILNYSAKRVGMLKEELYHYRLNASSTTKQRNSLHHLDRLEIELMKLDELKRRGLYQRYPENIDYDFLCLFFVNTIAILINKFDEIPSGLIQKMQQVTKKMIPKWKQNPLLQIYPEMNMMCQFIEYPFQVGNRTEVLEVYHKYREIYNID